jgi:Xaa-Pro aminopeptidase
VEVRGLIRPGITEGQLKMNYTLWLRRCLGTTCWHKRIVRSGRNTLLPYDENPPDLTIKEDDMLFLDLGPVFEKWEADFGRTFVLWFDPIKHKLRADVGQAFAVGILRPQTVAPRKSF